MDLSIDMDVVMDREGHGHIYFLKVADVGYEIAPILNRVHPISD
jgi:hypothetical protein